MYTVCILLIVVTTTRRGRPTQAEAKKLHQKLRTAAVATFVKYGYDGTTMEAIARAAGITRRTLYARYPDKRAVFVDVIPWALTRRTERESATKACTTPICAPRWSRSAAPGSHARSIPTWFG